MAWEDAAQDPLAAHCRTGGGFQHPEIPACWGTASLCLGVRGASIAVLCLSGGKEEFRCYEPSDKVPEECECNPPAWILLRESPAVGCGRKPHLPAEVQVSELIR